MKTKLHQSILLLSSLLILCLPVTNAQTEAEQIDQLLSQYTKYEQFNGSALVAKNGKVIFKKGYGMANMEWDIPNETDTKHRIASITKQFTCMRIMQLVQEGKLDLKTPISTYLSDYPKETADKINLHHLMTHTSGIPNYTSFPGFFENISRDPSTPTDFLKTFSDSTLNFTPGEKFAYSNSGYFLLGVIIEEVTGKSYEQNLQEHIFEPLGMNNSGFDSHAKLLKKRATGYSYDGVGYSNSPYLDMTVPYAAGSLYSTVEDLYLWDQGLYNHKILSPKYSEMMFSKYIPEWSGAHYGYGWIIGSVPVGTSEDTVSMIRHSGGINGFNTLITRMPEDKNLVVLLNNTGGADLEGITANINGILHNKSYEMPKRSLAKAVMQKISTENLDAGLKFIEKYKSDDTYKLSEGEFNNLGYMLMRDGDVKGAIAIFKINVAEFPESSNVYDSLGEAYLADGQKKLAVKNYKKAVEMDPKNENGKTILEQLRKEMK
ncbi:MAG: serine hydrolase [Saprospiraceae bacterium]